MIYYFAANSYEGCGHRHHTVAAARKCMKRINQRIPARRGRFKVYKCTWKDGRAGKAVAV